MKQHLRLYLFLFVSFQPPSIKHDWYQTEVAVVITVLVKNLKEEYLKINFTDRNVEVRIAFPEQDENKVTYNLAHKIVPEQCSYKITPSKVCAIKTAFDFIKS